MRALADGEPRLEIEIHDSPISGVRERASVLLRDRPSISALVAQRASGLACVYLDGVEVPPARWPWLRPRAGSRLTIVRRPGEPISLSAIGAFFLALGDAFVSTVTLGAVGGGFAAAYTGAATGAILLGSAIGSAAGTAALVIGAQTLSGSLVKAPDQQKLGSDSREQSPTQAGIGNQPRPRAPFPYVAGDYRFQPPLGAYPFTVLQGSESIFHALFIIGLGEHELTADDVMIGDLPISAYPGISLAIRDGSSTAPSKLQIYTNTVFQLALNNTFEPIDHLDPTLLSPWVELEVPGRGHDKLAVDFSFPGGIFRIASNGRQSPTGVGIQIQWNKNGGAWREFTQGHWSQTPSGRGNVTFDDLLLVIIYDGNSPRPFQAGVEWSTNAIEDTLDTDVFRVRVRRKETRGRGVLTGGGGANIVSSTFIWYALKGFDFNDTPIQTQGVATLEIRLPLDEHFQGVQNSITVRARRKVRIYDPAAAGGADADGWSLARFISRNPAAIARDMLQGVNARIPASDAELIVQDFTDWYQYCASFNDGGSGPLCFDYAFEDRQNLEEDLNVVAFTGRARLGRDSTGRWSPIFDGPKIGQTPRALLSAANGRNFKLERQWLPKVHAVRVTYVDRTSGFDSDAEMLVYADGYSAANAEEAHIFPLELQGVTEPKLAYAHARYFIADRELRARTLELECSMEHLAFRVGDLVSFAHPGALTDQGSGRVRGSSSIVYRDTLERDRAPYADLTKTLENCTGTYRDLSGSVLAGNGALEIVAQEATLSRVIQDFSMPQDWTGLRLDLAAQPHSNLSLAAGDGLRIRVSGPTTDDWSEWAFGYEDGLSADTLSAVGFLLDSTPDISAGTFNDAQVIRWEVQVNIISPLEGQAWRLNDFRVSRTDGKIVEVQLDQQVVLAVGRAYRIDHRRVQASPPRLLVDPLTIWGSSHYGLSTDRLVDRIYLQVPIPSGSREPMAGDLFVFGENSLTTVRAIVREKLAGSMYTARIRMVDEAPAVHNATGVLPDFAPGTSLPISLRQIGPAQPTIREAIADERALVRALDGSLRPRILLQLIPGTDLARPATDAFSVRYRELGESALHAIPTARVDGSASEIVISEVEQGKTYEVAIVAYSRDGLPSRETRVEVLVTGASNRPPDVISFRLEGLDLRWTLDNAPQDLAGFRISRSGVDGTFSQSVSIHGTALIAGPPHSIATLTPGTGKLYIVAEDFAGNQSENPAVISGFLGKVPENNIVDVYDVAAAGFPAIDQMQFLLNGFEDLIVKETPDHSITVREGATPDPITTLTSDFLGSGFDSVLTLDRDTPLVQNQSLKIIDMAGVVGGAALIYGATINRTNTHLEVVFNGLKAGTWKASLVLFNRSDATQFAAYEFPSLAGNTPHTLDADLALAPDSVGSGGAPDYERIGAVGLLAEHSSPAVGDESLWDDLQWVGGMVNGIQVSGGTLQTRQSGGDSFWNPDPNAPFWNPDPDAPFWASILYADGVFEFLVTPDSGAVPSDLRIELTVGTGTSYRIEYLLSDGTWSPFPGTLPVSSTDPILFRLLLQGGPIQAQVTALSVVFDVPDEQEEIEGFVVADTGAVRLPITKAYRSIRTVIPTIQADGNGGISMPVLDFATTIGAGPSVQVLSSTSTRVQGLVNVFVKGVKG